MRIMDPSISIQKASSMKKDPLSFHCPYLLFFFKKKFMEKFHSFHINIKSNLIVTISSHVAYFPILSSDIYGPHQWRSGSALKAGRLKVAGSFPDHACRPSRSEFPMVFSEICVNVGWDLL